MTAREATMREIASAVDHCKSAVAYRAAREGWPHREQRCRGGRRRLYPVASLPADVRTALGERQEDLPPRRRCRCPDAATG